MGSLKIESVAATGPHALRRRMRRPDFLRATGTGRRVSSRYFVVFFHVREAEGRAEAAAGGRESRPGEVAAGQVAPGQIARLGITVTKKVGKAVRRNRIKRLVREWFRTAKERLGSYDVVVIAKRDFPSRIGLAEVQADLDRALASGRKGSPCPSSPGPRGEAG